MKGQNRTLRIIGGKWRGRKVTFADNEALRPTTDRVRETLFNWLSRDISGATCLELYAGSGALSLEALSRGAAHATLVDNNKATIASLLKNFNSLDVDSANFSITHADAITWLANCTLSYDLIFLDPPYALAGDVVSLCHALAQNNIAASRVYLETNFAVSKDQLPEQWSIHRQKKAGSAHYCLLNTG